MNVESSSVVGDFAEAMVVTSIMATATGGPHLPCTPTGTLETTLPTGTAETTPPTGMLGTTTMVGVVEVTPPRDLLLLMVVGQEGNVLDRCRIPLTGCLKEATAAEPAVVATTGKVCSAHVSRDLKPCWMTCFPRRC